MQEGVILLINAGVTLFSVGGFAGIFTVKQDRKSKELDNQEKEHDIKEKEKDDVIQDGKDIAEERKKRCVELTADSKEKDERLRAKDELISDLRQKLDDRNTYCGVAELLRCSRIECPQRLPPFSSTVLTSDRAIQDYIDRTKEESV